MKYFYLLMLSLMVSVYVSSQMKAGLSYALTLPQHEMKNNIKPVHSLNINFLSSFKHICKLSWGIEAGYGLYAVFTKDQDIRFPDGSGFNTKVNYSSNVASAGLFTRFQLFKDAPVNPYLTGKLGYASFFSRVIVDDPEDEEHCKPLESKTPISDHSFFTSYGAGLLLDISSKKKPKNAWLDISINQLHGTKLSYINIKDIKNNMLNDPNNPPPASDKTVPLSIPFLNVSTQTIHEHQLAEVYTSPLRLLELKIGVLWRIDN